MVKDDIVKKIQDEVIDYKGVVNFASKGITGDPEMLIRAFNFGKEIGIECAKEDAIRIILESKW